MAVSILLQALAWLCAAFIVFVTVAPLRFKPRLPSRERTRTHVNIERMLAFALMAFLFVIAYPTHHLSVGAACVLAAGLSEMTQFLSPTRHARWNDAAAKMAGAILGLVCALAVLSWFGLAPSA